MTSAGEAASVLHLGESDFDTAIARGLTLVDFWAAWCGPCVALAPAVEQLAQDYAGRVQVAKVDIDAHPGIPGRFGIRGIPTVILFRDGEQVDIMVGNNPQKLRSMVEAQAPDA